MATRKFIGRSSSFGSVDFSGEKMDKPNNHLELQDLMAILVERQRLAICLRAQKGVTESQAAHCGCILCSPEGQRERFGATFEEIGAKFAEEEASAAVRTKAREKTRYVHRLLTSAGARHNRLQSFAIRGL
jgi:hypothetical protein